MEAISGEATGLSSRIFFYACIYKERGTAYYCENANLLEKYMLRNKI